MKLMGVDVGFSKKAQTTGIACLDADKLTLARAGSSWESRKATIPACFHPTVIALDGPLIPQDAEDVVRRSCEFRFIRAPFHNRCKPGLSHWGMGLQLRHATADASAQFMDLLSDSTAAPHEAYASYATPVIEAFPNAFLAVLLPQEDFRSAPKLRRGRRFDWLYDRVATNSSVRSALSKSLDLPGDVWHSFDTQCDHELRAALVCLLTAAFAAQGKAHRVGDDQGGWFWLPPQTLWQNWAREGLSKI